ncbi:error-prone DNA polymerase [Mangrovibacterium diazotrophicum]|uniref:Error-prone DNA polymerase n=1 Tax=Mangrovibacterium diazotrophicum TaxID=1261403 RepID=A0A419VW27_9BACT|nr:error-prone DNA polymerase [Mangrovibacterium diazotrophicum]RKD86360.1 error-prone DNA polymerase [Mangrovibacterium diazotrophicum]
MNQVSYTELQVTSNFTFLRGGSGPDELVERAEELGYTAIAITDRNSLAGIVRAHVAARSKKIRFIPACRLDLLDGPSLLAYPTCREGYSNLSGLLSTGNLRTEKGKCELYRADVFQYAANIQFVLLPPDSLNADFEFQPEFILALKEYRQVLGKSLHLAASFTYRGDDQKRMYQLSQLAKRYRVPLVATNDVHYHGSERRELQDVLTCIREKCTISSAGFKLHQNAERYLKPIDELKRLFLQYPEAIQNAQRLADLCNFSLDELRYLYPEEITSSGRKPMEELIYLCWKGAHERWGETIPPKIKATIEMELEFIGRKDYASYFLTVYDYVREARSRGILCQGRGSAANSVVCYCLGITSVDPSKFKLLFARFMSDERNEPPDIDVDFEHERREEIMQYIYNKYGRDRAGIVATVTQVHWKGAIRDVGKVMGLSTDSINLLSKSAYEFTEDWFTGKTPESTSFNPNDLHLRKVLELTGQYIGFPRQLGQHTGGFVITRGKLHELCPILNARMEDRTCIEWNKDDIEALGFLKVDVLALGMLTCIQKAFKLAKQHYNLDLTLANIPQDDPKVYEMISHADTLGVFQIESRAQMSMLPRLKPTEFYDLVIEVAIVRPGPIQGDMVHPYLRRRDGKEPIEFPSEELKEILHRTKGVPLFQEQAMEIAIVAAGFTPAEADGLRRAMATFKSKGKVSWYHDKLVSGMIRKGYTNEFAERVFKQIEGFGSYGFPESHAASFALLVYISSWIKCYYPDIFAAALLNSQPMGFYQPAQIVIDARKHGVMVRPVDVNYSDWDNTLEEKDGHYCAVRLGFRQVTGLREEEMKLLILRRKSPYKDIDRLVEIGIMPAALERLADADAFRSLGLDRRRALWEVSAMKDHPTGMFTGTPSASSSEQQTELPVMSDGEHVIQDYASTTLSLKAHPVSFARATLNNFGVTTTSALNQLKNGDRVKVCGLITVRQRPGTAKGVLFITIEDETGFANLVVWANTFEKYRKVILQSRLLMVEGKLQIEGEVIHVVVSACFNLNKLMDLRAEGRNLGSMNKPTGASKKYPAEVLKSEKARPVQTVQGELFRSRDFK